MPLCAARAVRRLLFSALFVALTCGLAARAVARTGEAAPLTVGAVVSEAQYSVTAGDRFATVDLEVTVAGREDGWQSVPLIPSAVIMRSCKVSGRRGHIERTADRYVGHLRGKGKCRIELQFVLDVERRGVERVIRLPLVRAASGRIDFELDKPDYAVKAAPEVPMEVSTAAGSTRATLYVGGLGALNIRWLPQEIARERAAVFEAREESIVSLRTGGVRRDTRVFISVSRGEIGSLIIRVPHGVDVLNVSAPSRKRRPETIIDSWHIDPKAREPKIHVRFTKPASGSFQLHIASEQVPDEAAGLVHILPLVFEGAARQTGHVGVLARPSFTITDAGSKGLGRAPAAALPGPARVRRAPRTALAFEYHKLPWELKLDVAPISPRITAATASHVRLQAGVVELLAKIAYRIENTPVERLRVGLDEGLIVLGVTGKRIETWAVEKDHLLVRLKQPILGDYTLTLKCLQNLRRIDGVLIPLVRCLDAEQQSGSIGISAGEDVALLHYRSKRFVQVNVKELPRWVRVLRPKLGYIYDHPGGMLAVSTSLIKPALRVEGYGVARVAEDAVQEEYVFICTVERRPVFSFRLHLPDGLRPINLLGDGVTDWEFYPKQGTLQVALGKACLGRARLHLFCERRLAPDTQPLALGGVAVRDADHASGWFGVGTEANLDLVPSALRGMVAGDIKDAPRLLSSYGKLHLAFRWSGGDWGMTCAAEPVAPRIEAETRTALLFGAGHMRTVTDATWHISKAKTDELVVALPEGAVNVQVTGKDILNQEPADGLRRIRLAEPVKGKYQMRVTFDQLPDRRTGEMRYTGIKLAERQRGVIGVYLEDPKLEVSPGRMVNADRTDAAPGIAIGEYPCLGTFDYSEPERSIVFEMKGHTLARGVLLNAEQCRVATVVKEQGRAMSYLSCRLRNAGTQFFRMKLPEGAELMAAYVMGEPVRPNRLPEGDILVPVTEAPVGTPFDLGVIWSEPVGKMGLGTSFALISPKLDLPAQEVNWDVYLPRNYQVLTAGGNMEMLRREVWYQQGLPGVAWRNMRGSWPTIRTVLIVLLCALAAGVFIYGIVVAIRRAVKASREWRATHPQAVRQPRLVRRRLLEIFVILLVIVVLAGLTLPALRSAREEARKASSKSNLKQIGDAIDVYMQNYGGYMPPSLDHLYPEFVGALKVFRCPSTEAETYVYGGAIDPAQARSDTPIAWDPPDAYEGGRNVLYFDGHVGFEGRPAGAEEEADGMMTRGLRRDVGGYIENRRAELKDIGVKGRPEAGHEVAREPMRPASASPSEPPPEQVAKLDAERQQVVTGQIEEQARRGRYSRAMKLGESYRKRGAYDKAREQYDRALRQVPDSKQAVAARERLDELGQLIPKKELEAKATPAKPKEMPAAPPPAKASYGANALITLSEKLQSEGGKDWREDAAETGVEAKILDLVTGREKEVKLKDGTVVTVRNGELHVTGTAGEVRAVAEATKGLRSRMIEQSRQITRAKQKREAALAARRRAALKQRARATTFKMRRHGGTVAGSRAAGAMPLKISFPSVGTKAYPFHMDYAGTSQARIEITCLRAGAAMVLQGVIAIVVLLCVGITSWRNVKIGIPVAVILALLLAFLMTTVGEASKPYIVMALVGLAFAALVILVRVATAARVREGRGERGERGERG